MALNAELVLGPSGLQCFRFDRHRMARSTSGVTAYFVVLFVVELLCGQDFALLGSGRSEMTTPALRAECGERLLSIVAAFAKKHGRRLTWNVRRVARPAVCPHAERSCDAGVFDVVEQGRDSKWRRRFR